MTSLVGDDPYAVELIDTGVSFVPDVKTITPENPYQLVKWILDLAAWKEQTQHYLEDGIPDELDSAANPEHAFNIAFKYPDIAAFVQSQEKSDQWLQEKAIQPNIAIGSSLIDDNTKQGFSNSLLGWVGQNAGDSSPVLEQYKAALAQANQQQLSVHDYAVSLLATLVSDLQADDNTAKQIAIVFDSILMQSLPTAASQQLTKNTLGFALTNWNQGDENLYFCVFFNPRTSKLSFGAVTEDKSQLIVMDENQWVDQKTWEVVPIEESIKAPPPPPPPPPPPAPKPAQGKPKGAKTPKPVQKSTEEKEEPSR